MDDVICTNHLWLIQISLGQYTPCGRVYIYFPHTHSPQYPSLTPMPRPVVHMVEVGAANATAFIGVCQLHLRKIEGLQWLVVENLHALRLLVRLHSVGDKFNYNCSRKSELNKAVHIHLCRSPNL